MLWFKLVSRFIKLLQSNVSPSQIAGGICLGAIIGLTPFLALHNLFIFLLIIIINVNISSAMLAVAFFSIVGYFTDPLAHIVGRFLLVEMDSLAPFWTSLYNMPIVPFTRFYNTVVLGSFVISLIIFIPLFIATRKFIVSYRTNLSIRVEKWKIVKLFKVSKIYNFYKKLSSFKP